MDFSGHRQRGGSVGKKRMQQPKVRGMLSRHGGAKEILLKQFAKGKKCLTSEKTSNIEQNFKSQTHRIDGQY